MPRDCNHMPGAAKAIECPLCKFLKEGGKMSKNALQVLNQQPKRKAPRACPRCGGEARGLVTREGELMCNECAVSLDEVEES